MYEKIEQLMKEKGVTAYRISKETGINQSLMSEWKRGTCVPKADKLKILADYFGVSVDYFLN